MSLTAAAVVGLAVSLDLLFGEPRTALHPVAWFGRVVALADREWPVGESGRRALGVVVALALPLAAAGVVGAIVSAAGSLHYAATPIAAGVALYLTTSLRSLLDLAGAVVAATEADPEGAREAVRGLVGRETAPLSPALLRSAAVESVGENLSDGFVATLLPFAVLAPISLPLAAAVSAWVKAVNTLDSMVGYPEKPIGTASARLDDAVMWVPARTTAALLALAGGRPRTLGRVRRWARAPPSPNAGWPMAAVACLLDVRLEKPGVYVLNPDAALPTVADGERAIALARVAAALAVVLAVLGATFTGEVASWLQGTADGAVVAGAGAAVVTVAGSAVVAAAFGAGPADSGGPSAARTGGVAVEGGVGDHEPGPRSTIPPAVGEVDR